MKTVKQKIPYGKRSIEFSLPRSGFLGRVEHPAARGPDIGKLLSAAFAGPLGKVTLESAVRGKRKVLIVVTDATRKACVKEILPRLLRTIDDGARTITIIVATGLHKTHDKKELKDLLGEAVVARYGVRSHGLGNGDIVKLGVTKRGVPITLDGNLFEHDVVLSIGTVEPHLYAGYSGGAKTIAIGLAGRETIDATHGVRFLDDRMTRIGSIGRNPFQETLWEIASHVPLRFSVNVVNDHAGRAIKIFCGETRAVFRAGVDFARKLYEVTVRKSADIVLCGIGYPKDINLYQASRAINYVLNVDRPVLKRGGVLIVAAELKDGAGTSPAEFMFYDMLRKMECPRRFLATVKKEGCVAGAHRAYMVAGPLVNYEIIFVTGRDKKFMEGLPLRYATTIREALDRAEKITGKQPTIYVIPHALATIARVGG